MNLLNPQEAPGEADDPRAGDQPEGVGHPRRRVLVAQVRAEAHQGIAIPAVSAMAPLIQSNPEPNG